LIDSGYLRIHQHPKPEIAGVTNLPIWAWFGGIAGVNYITCVPKLPLYEEQQVLSIIWLQFS